MKLVRGWSGAECVAAVLGITAFAWVWLDRQNNINLFALLLFAVALVIGAWGNVQRRTSAKNAGPSPRQSPTIALWSVIIVAAALFAGLVCLIVALW